MKRCKFTQFAFANLGKTITKHKNDRQSKCLRKRQLYKLRNDLS